MNMIRNFVPGGDTRAKDIATGDGFALFTDMNTRFWRAIDEAILNGDVKLVPDDNESWNFEEDKRIKNLFYSYFANKSETDAARKFIP